VSLLLAVQGAPPTPTVKNYYTGGFANARRLTRGLGFGLLTALATVAALP
jgi:hypothetical protein